MNQTQLDRILRKAAGKNAIEEMILETIHQQVYRMSNGKYISIRKSTGETLIIDRPKS